MGINIPNLTYTSKIELFECRPNPFDSKTIISYKLNEKMFVNVSLYNMLGQKVSELAHCYQEAGNYIIEFDAKGIEPGMYYCVINPGTEFLTLKLIAH